MRANRGIGDAVRGKPDMDCLRALPKDLSDWQATVEFTLGPYATGRDLRDISAIDFSRSSALARSSSMVCLVVLK